MQAITQPQGFLVGLDADHYGDVIQRVGLILGVGLLLVGVKGQLEVEEVLVVRTNGGSGCEGVVLLLAEDLSPA